jgi:hypothetical protein
MFLVEWSFDGGLTMFSCLFNADDELVADAAQAKFDSALRAGANLVVMTGPW